VPNTRSRTWWPGERHCSKMLEHTMLTTREELTAASAERVGDSGFAPVGGSPVGTIRLLLCSPDGFEVASTGLACLLGLAMKSAVEEGAKTNFPRPSSAHPADDAVNRAWGQRRFRAELARLRFRVLRGPSHKYMSPCHYRGLSPGSERTLVICGVSRGSAPSVSRVRVADTIERHRQPKFRSVRLASLKP